ncbi:hypothetical protein BRC60_05895 [Halobacteriales archaeon QH_1_68_42]|nr:MAG: hypothetical protein BRC60_05895 [Halobacteriales archaeon QH_1_68_42]
MPRRRSGSGSGGPSPPGPPTALDWPASFTTCATRSGRPYVPLARLRGDAEFDADGADHLDDLETDAANDHDEVGGGH